MADVFSVQRAVYAVAQELTPVSLWIYAAGDIAAGPVADMDPAAWRRIVDANLTGAFLATHSTAPLLAEDAHLVFLGATASGSGCRAWRPTPAAKAGLEAFVATLAKEQRRRRVTLVPLGPWRLPYGIKCRSVCPVPLEPDDLAQRILAFHEAESAGSWKRRIVTRTHVPRGKYLGRSASTIPRNLHAVHKESKLCTSLAS